LKLLAGALLIGLASQGSVGAAQAPPPASVPEPTLMIVEFPRGTRFIGFPKHCPGSTDDTEDDEVCLAELYEGPAFVVRHLSGPPVRRGERLRLTAHSRNWPAGTRMLVLTRPFDDQGTTGNFAIWWQLPDEDDNYCQTTESLAEWGDDPVTRQFAQGYRRRFRPDGYLERADFRCIEG
jgi:hypothetical protein